MSDSLVGLIRAEARTFHQGRRKRLARLCDRAADVIAAGRERSGPLRRVSILGRRI